MFGRGQRKGFNPRRRFLLMLILVYALSLPVISGLSYLILRDYAIKVAYNAGELYLVTIEEIKHYVADKLRPTLYRELPGRFVLEGMSRSFVSNTIARWVNERYPGYRYKDARICAPKNPENSADEFEGGIIKIFADDPGLTEWRGIRDMPDGKYYVIARRGEAFGESCLRCHGDPGAAPRELVEKYGPVAGFYARAGQLLDAKLVYIPLDLALAGARRNVTIFIGLYTIAFSIIFLIINVRFTSLYDRLEARNKEVEIINTDLTELNQELETMVAERTMSLMALTLADRVRNPSAVIGWTCRRILEREEKEPLPENVTDALEGVRDEAEKLERIVKDFEALLRSKRSMYIHADVNEIIKRLLPILEKEAEGKGVELVVNLDERTLKINTQRNLLRAALFHTVRNALEATPPGGEIKISSEERPDSVVITISDTGMGISEEDLKKIFEPFFSTKSQRFGVGLALVKQIVSEHLGNIEVRSEPGRGTTFTMTFPTRWTNQAAQPLFTQPDPSS